MTANQIYDQEKTSKPSEADEASGQEAEEVRDATGQPKLVTADQAKELKDQFNLPSNDHQVGKGHTGQGVPKKKGFFSGMSRRKKVVGFAGIGIGGTIIAFMIFLLPVLRLESYVKSIDNRAFAATSDAVQKRMTKLFDRYMINYVINLDACKNKVNKNCRKVYTKGIASGMFTAWRDARIEQTLVDRYGLEFTSYPRPKPGQPRITIHSRTLNRSVILTEGDIKAGKFSGGPREMGNEVNQFLRENTKWYEVMHRHSVRKYLARKHGIKFWCIFKCKQKDAIDRQIKDAPTKLKYKLLDRVVYPFSGKYGLIMDCILQGERTGRCSSKSLRERGIDQESMSNKEIEEIRKLFVDKDGKPIQRKFLTVVIERLLAKVMGTVAAREVVSAIPIAGQIYLALSVIDMMHQMDGFIKNHGLSHFAADITTRSYAAWYATMRTAADEIKPGGSSISEVGAIADDYGGQYPAERSRIYQTYNETGRTTQQMAATEAKDEVPYVCPNGDPIPPDQYVCGEYRVDRSFKIEDIRNNKLVDGIIGILDTYGHCFGVHDPITGSCLGIRPSTIIHNVLKTINFIASKIIGGLVAAILAVLRAIPYVKDIVKYATEKTAQLLEAFLTKIFPLAVGPASAGREKYDGNEGGAEVAASEFGQGGYTAAGESYGLGGQTFSDSQEAAVLDDYNQQQNFNYQHSSFLAKVADLDTPSSLGSRLVAAMPTSTSGFFHKFSSAITSPFTSSFYTAGHAKAGGVQMVKSPIGMPHNGYTVNDPAYDANPDIYTPAYCAQLKAKWLASSYEDPVTGLLKYKTTNPCLLEQAVAEDGSGFQTGNDDIGDAVGPTSNQSAPTTTTPATGTAVVGNLGESSDTVPCAAGTSDMGTVTSNYAGEFKTTSGPLILRLCQIPSLPGEGNNTSGQEISGGAIVNSRVSGAWQALAQQAKQDGVKIASSSSFRLADSCGGSGNGTACARPGRSPHQLGVAIDFQGFDYNKIGSDSSCSGRSKEPGNPVWEWLFKNAGNFGFKQYSAEAWHWDPLPLSNRCGAT